MAKHTLSPLVPWIGYPDFEALAAASAAVPDDDGPRLVLADWLQERDAEDAAGLARHPRFLAILAMARYEKATGRPASEALASVAQAFADASRHIAETIAPAMQRVAEAFRNLPVANLGRVLREANRQQARTTRAKVKPEKT